jgi:hypothetical protein
MERFRRGWWGWIRSSDGYSIRLMGRTRLQYRDALGELDIFAEPMSEPWSDIVVDTSSIPDTPDRTRAEVVDKLHRAFRFAGWTLIEAGRGDTRTTDA